MLPGNIILKLGDGEIAFGYIAGTKEEFPHDLIIIHLPGWTQLFGEWQRKFADNGNDFDVEILGFGYISADIVGSPEPAHRFTFSKVERERIEMLARALFADTEARAQQWQLRGAHGHFMGNVIFAPGWLREA